MKKHMIAALAAAPILLSNHAFATQEWRGGGFVTFLNQACVDGGASGAIGEVHYRNVRYRPPNISDNGPNTRIAFYSSFGATSYRLLSGNLGTVFQDVEGGSTFSATFLFSNQARMRITVRQPSSITENSPWVRLRGQIRSWEDNLNCRVTFDATLTRRP